MTTADQPLTGQIALVAGSTLAADPDVLASTGRALSTAGLYPKYRFTDVDGSQPDFPAYWATALEAEHGPLGEPL
jgi:hypothetical protein